MEQSTGKVREFYQLGKVGTMRTDASALGFGSVSGFKAMLVLSSVPYLPDFTQRFNLRAYSRQAKAKVVGE